MININQLLKDLILLPSNDGKEILVGDYLFELLDSNGFEVEKCLVTKNRFNIIARLGKPKIYLAAHMDTVSPYLEYEENATHVFGRGACDTKGSTAAMITAALMAKEEGVSDFGLIFTVGEEVSLDGVQTLTKMGYEIPFVVVGEPTSLKVVNAHFGILVIKLVVHGKAAHSSQPAKGINAIDLLLAAIHKIKQLTVFPESLMSLVQIGGGTADNIIPGEAFATFSFRISPNDRNDYVQGIKNLIGETIKLEIIETSAVSCEIPKVLSFLGRGRTAKYLTELSFYQKGIVLGPGDIKYAHGSNEQISKKELNLAVQKYLLILRNFS